MSTNEEGRRLASQRDDLIARGVDPALLDVPLAGTAPTPPAVPDCGCPPCPGRGNDGHGMTHCAECCFGSGVEADIDCPVHGAKPDVSDWLDAAVEAGARSLAEIEMVDKPLGTEPPPWQRFKYEVEQIVEAALPHITRGAADAVEVELEGDPVDPGYVCGIENAATIVRNFGSEVGRA